MDLIDQAIIMQQGEGIQRDLASTNREGLQKQIVPEFFSNSIVLFVIVCFEIIVCWRGFHFFRGVDFDLATALVLSVGCEVLYMYASAQSGKTLFAFRFILLALSMTFLSYSTYKDDENLVSLKRSMASKKESIISEINLGKKQLERIERDLNTLDGSMNVYVKHDLVTKGIKTLAPERERLRNESRVVKEGLVSLKDDLERLNDNSLSLNLFKTYKILTIKSYVTLATFLVFQTLICVILPNILRSVFSKGGQ